MTSSSLSLSGVMMVASWEHSASKRPEDWPISFMAISTVERVSGLGRLTAPWTKPLDWVMTSILYFFVGLSGALSWARAGKANEKASATARRVFIIMED